MSDIKNRFTLDVITGPFPRIMGDWYGIGFKVRLNFDGKAVCET